MAIIQLIGWFVKTIKEVRIKKKDLDRKVLINVFSFIHIFSKAIAIFIGIKESDCIKKI